MIILSLLLAAALAGCLSRPTAERPPMIGSASPGTATHTPTPTRATATLPPTAQPPIETPTALLTPTRTSVETATIVRAYPRVDGSTSTYPLEVMAACTLLEVPCLWQPEGPANGVERFLMPDPRLLDTAKEAIFNPIIHWGTHEAYVKLIKGEADFILVARSPSADELVAANVEGVMLDVRPVALDAFVFLVNAGNPVDSISLEQARRIYTGDIANWSVLDGLDRPIQAYQRDANSGSQELMEALVMQGAPMIEAPDMILFTMAGPVNAIHDDVAGIGYSVYYYAAFIMPDEQVKLLALEGVVPTWESIAQRAYPLTTEVYAAVRQGMPADSPAVLLRDWLLTPDGQAAVAASGYVPLH